MILGNPYTFSIIAQTIDEWNINDAFRNGILIFCVDGHIYPEEIVNATLNCEIPFLRRALKNLTTDTSLYNKPKEIAFSEMYGITFPEEDVYKRQAMEGVSSLTYNAVGSPLTVTNENGASIGYVYDANGNVTQQTDPRGCLLYTSRCV